MADPLIVDPALQAEVIRQFNLRGELSPFVLTNRVIPIFDIGRLASLNVPQVVTTTEGQQGVRVGTASGVALVTAPPSHNDGDITDGGFTVNPLAAAIIADSGQLTAGLHLIDVTVSGNAIYDFLIEWRDAANAVTLTSWSVLAGGVGVTAPARIGPLLGSFLTDERIRVQVVSLVAGTVSAVISHGAVFPSVAV